ncbi:flavodoxin-dependent (E)-4-hydroxy-3-methylbut-2-enyl-diphosphate synthase [Ancylomarina sp. 16SWW S1-10-2]|uniref:flavodoxin-dependent (E)-4-hydroxy-3-methylbut-2-enyl-diphosphate synthase n=1 Tax=Ancylomarina sp. 16SWW S1-10-2 TaxID=2499681 RepID=UPI0012AE0751|nr:flavodoxin-dependent (E)-4-hydroxy-3-methylbut-2-enyl-diphosphate synthase [Ancylomarina sp. 16SWW S1-10-2]MRT92404.1 4-hydroxy-3-methylbut-2-en-1-yl diphosphate synthase [Ancylomarina sp. 16SWW S1-10-2]
MTISKYNTFCKDLFNYSRRISSICLIGKTPLGAEYPIRIQSMTNTDTNDVEASVSQAIRMIESGAEYVRLTAQGKNEAENLKFIKASLLEKGYETPLVADIHFNPEAATIAAQYVDKIRVNPGNFVDKRANLDGSVYSDEMYQEGFAKIRSKFIPLLNICKEYKTAIRIGTNHGSLSDRVMSRYGDTPQGMVESTLEFLRICKEESFSNVVISIKSSNTVVMVKTVRLLVSEMNKEELYFPLHLGVTEAGEGEDGRIKSAVGTAALLNDGLGDTIRISLTEDPEVESPVGRKMVDYILEKEGHAPIESPLCLDVNLYEFYKRSTQKVANIGGGNQAIVIADCSLDKCFSSDFPEQIGYKMNADSFEWEKSDLAADYIYINGLDPAIRDFPEELGFIVDSECWEEAFLYSERVQPLFSSDAFFQNDLSAFNSDVHFISCEYSNLTEAFIEKLKTDPKAVLLCESKHQNTFAEQRAFVFKLIQFNCKTPVVFHLLFNENKLEDLQLKSACDFGPLFIDGLGTGICLNNIGDISREDINATAFGILQAARVRTSKTEFVSCPGCGRTLFDLQEVVSEVKQRCAHLSHLKIGVMGCIVNGPGEMGDVDYGYVGAGIGRVSLYKSQKVIKKNILSEDAIEELIQIIKDNGDWKDVK